MMNLLLSSVSASAILSLGGGNPPIETLMSARYVRLRAPDTTAVQDRLGMAEIIFYDENDDPITITGSAVSQFAGSSFVKENAYDGNLSTVWSSGGSAPTNPVGNWISFDFGEEKQISRFECTWRNNSESPADFVIEVSDDNITFTEYAFYPDINVWGFRNRNWRVPRINDSMPHYLYYRLDVTANNSGGTDRLSIEYVEMRTTRNVAGQAAVTNFNTVTDLPNTGYAQADSDFGINSAGNAFIDDTQFWAASPTTGQGYLQFNFNQPTRIEQITIRSRDSSFGVTQSPRDFSIQGSNDRTNWETLASYTGEVDWGEKETRVFDVVSAGEPPIGLPTSPSVAGISGWVTDWAANGPPLTITAPSGIVEGDLLFAVVCAGASGGSVIPPDDSWRHVTTIAITSGQSATFCKVATDTEPASYTFTTGGATRMLGGMIRISGVDVTDPIEAYAEFESTGNSTDHTSPSVTTSSDNSLILSIANGHFGDSVTYTPPVDITELWDISHVATGDDAASMAVGWKVQATAGATGSFSWTATAAYDRRSTTIALRPANPAAAPVIESHSSAVQESTASSVPIAQTHAAENVGDLMVACVSGGGNPTDIVAPAGWTEVLQHPDGNVRMGIFWKEATDTVPTAYSFTLTGSSSPVAVTITNVKDGKLISPVDQTGTGVTTLPSLTSSEAETIQFAMLATARQSDDTVMKGNTITLDELCRTHISSTTFGVGHAVHIKNIPEIAGASLVGGFTPDSSNSGCATANFKTVNPPKPPINVYHSTVYAVVRLRPEPKVFNSTVYAVVRPTP